MPKTVVYGCVTTAFVLWCGVAFADVIEGVVVGVRDGDTIVVLDKDKKQHVVRLNGIDAPEKAQPYGNRSRQQLATLVFKEQVIVEWKKRDRYKRIVGKVLLESPKPVCVSSDCQSMQDAGLALITVGLAWHYKQYEREQMRRIEGFIVEQNMTHGILNVGFGKNYSLFLRGYGGRQNSITNRDGWYTCSLFIFGAQSIVTYTEIKSKNSPNQRLIT